MAKYLLLAFDEDADAEEFAKAMLAKRVMPALPDKPGITLRGMWKKPTMFCQCTAIKGRAWTRGKKWGWWVCTQCGRPSVGWSRGDVWYTALGKNILPISNDAPEYRGPEHKFHPGYEGPPHPDQVKK